jgi:hypothetical protein
MNLDALSSSGSKIVVVGLTLIYELWATKNSSGSAAVIVPDESKTSILLLILLYLSKYRHIVVDMFFH